MGTTDDDIRAFLRNCDAMGDHALDVALFFARSMLSELQSATSEWETAVTALETRLSVRQTEGAERRGSLFGLN